MRRFVKKIFTTKVLCVFSRLVFFSFSFLALFREQSDF